MRQQKKYTKEIPQHYKAMPKELADYKFFYMLKIFLARYEMDACVPFFQALCEMSNSDRSIIMNLIVQIRMYPERYRHDIRHVAFLMYAMDEPISVITWALHTQARTIRIWVDTQLKRPPEIKRLFTNEETDEIIKVLSIWKFLKGVPI